MIISYFDLFASYVDQLMAVASLQRNGAKLFAVGTTASLVSLFIS